MHICHSFELPFLFAFIPKHPSLPCGPQQAVVSAMKLCVCPPLIFFFFVPTSASLIPSLLLLLFPQGGHVFLWSSACVCCPRHHFFISVLPHSCSSPLSLQHTNLRYISAVRLSVCLHSPLQYVVWSLWTTRSPDHQPLILSVAVKEKWKIFYTDTWCMYMRACIEYILTCI